MEPTDSYYHVCMPFGHSYVLLLVVFLVLCMLIVGGLDCVCMHGIVESWERLIRHENTTRIIERDRNLA